MPEFPIYFHIIPYVCVILILVTVNGMFVILIRKERRIKKRQSLQHRLPSQLEVEVEFVQRLPPQQQQGASRAILRDNFTVYTTKCGVCMEELKEDDDDCRVVFLCKRKHQYHKLCIDDHCDLLQNSRCPLCHASDQSTISDHQIIV